jgi:hypothetical protein
MAGYYEHNETSPKKKIFKWLKIFLVVVLIIGYVGGMFYYLDREDKMHPKYIIRTEKDFYRTDTFSVDSNKCINFISIESRLFNDVPRKRPVQICGGRYIIEEKWRK